MTPGRARAYLRPPVLGRAAAAPAGAPRRAVTRLSGVLAGRARPAPAETRSGWRKIRTFLFLAPL
ncbi:hypothetical protein EMIT0158MI4_10409 [Burkholderia ambifaria]